MTKNLHFITDNWIIISKITLSLLVKFFSQTTNQLYTVQSRSRLISVNRVLTTLLRTTVPEKVTVNNSIILILFQHWIYRKILNAITFADDQCKSGLSHMTEETYRNLSKLLWIIKSFVNNLSFRFLLSWKYFPLLTLYFHEKHEVWNKQHHWSEWTQSVDYRH